MPKHAARARGPTPASRESASFRSSRHPGECRDPAPLPRRLATPSFPRRRESVVMMLRSAGESEHQCVCCVAALRAGIRKYLRGYRRAQRPFWSCPKRSLDSKKGARIKSTQARCAGSGPNARITRSPEFVGKLSHSMTEVGSRRDRARLERRGSMLRNQACGRHFVFASPASPDSSWRRDCRPERAAAAAPTVSNSERSRRAAPSSKVAPTTVHVR